MAAMIENGDIATTIAGARSWPSTEPQPADTTKPLRHMHGQSATQT